MPEQITVTVDRDSVAMGDDVSSHERTLTVDAGTPLSRLLELAAPEIRAPGWSWVATTEAGPVAVWSVDHGVQLLVEDAPVTAEIGPHDVLFRYFMQIDPAWLHARLAEGAAPRRDVLEREYRPLAQAAREREDRRRERELPERLLTPECVAAVEGLGAATDLHNDRTYRFDLLGEGWAVSRADTMTQVFRGAGTPPIASVRPTSFAECWLVAMVAAQVRAARGLPRLPDVDSPTAPELRPMGPDRWQLNGPLTVQLRGEAAVAAYRLAFGRSIAEILALTAPGITTA